jgi:hypothetical protein
MLVLGDAHASEPEKRADLLAAYDAADEELALQVGDLEWYDLPVETWFVAGNNEDFDVLDALRDADLALADVDGRDPNLEDVFLEVTNHSLGGDAA